MSQISKFRLNLSDIDNTTITFDSQGRIQAAGGSINVQTISGNANTPVPPVAGNIQILGVLGITFTEDVANNRLLANVTGGGMKWNDILVGPQPMAINNGYLAHGVAQISLSLPATAAFGDKIEIAGFGAGGWTITQGAGQQIISGNQSTTIGVGGTVTSTNQFDQIELLCVVANTTWLVNDVQGNLIIV